MFVPFSPALALWLRRCFKAVPLPHAMFLLAFAGAPQRRVARTADSALARSASHGSRQSCEDDVRRVHGVAHARPVLADAALSPKSTPHRPSRTCLCAFLERWSAVGDAICEGLAPNLSHHVAACAQHYYARPAVGPSFGAGIVIDPLEAVESSNRFLQHTEPRDPPRRSGRHVPDEVLGSA